MQSNAEKIDQIRNAISRGDVEYLFGEYKKALTERRGEEIIDLIEESIDEVARIQHLPPATSFQELMHNYDLREYETLIKEGDFGLLAELIRNSHGRRTVKLVQLALDKIKHFPLPSQKEMAFFLVEMVKKVGRFPQLEDYLLKYKYSGQKRGEMEGGTILNHLLIREIADLLRNRVSEKPSPRGLSNSPIRKEGDPKTEQIFRDIFERLDAISIFDRFLENEITAETVPK